jgi:hypothetical protein
MFGTLSADFLTPVLEISKRGNIGGDGFAPLEVSRQLSHWFGQGLTVMRIPTVVMGIAAIYFIQKIFSERFKSKFFGIFAALTIFFNLYFQNFQHSAIILMVSFSLATGITWASIKLVKDFNIKNILQFLFFSFFISHYYVFGRYVFILILFSTIFFTLKKRNIRFKFWKDILFSKLWGGYFLLLIIFQSLSGKESFRRFWNIPEFIFPSNGLEIQFGGASFVDTFIFNLKQLLESFYGFEGNLITNHSIFINGSMMIPYWPFLLSIGVTLGFVFWILKLFKEKKFTHFDYVILIWLIVGAGFPLASKLVSPTMSSISPYRIFFSIFSFSFFLTFLISNIYTYNKKFAYLLMCLSLGGQISQLYLCHKHRSKFFENFNSINKIEGYLENIYGPSKSIVSNYLFYYQYNWHLSKNLKTFIIEKKSNVPNIFILDLEKLNKNYEYPSSIQYIKHFNFQIPLISLYLGELNQYVNQIYFNNSEFKFQVISWKDFDSQKRSYPVSPHKHPDKIDKTNFRIETNAKYPVKLSRDYIVYDDLELEVLKLHLDNNGVHYNVHKFNYSNWD